MSKYKTHQELVGLDDEALLSIFSTATHQHYKGGLYRVLGRGKHTETNEPVVLYQHLFPYEQKLYVRPEKMFDELIDVTRPRFREISRPETPEDVIKSEWHKAVSDFGLRPGSNVEVFMGRILKRIRGF